MRLFLAGDVFPTEENELYFKNGRTEDICDSELLSLMSECDFRVCNLEGALTNTSKAISKSGPCIKASEECINGIKALGFDAVSLANNHIMDYGTEGYLSTLKALEENDIEHFGSGINLADLYKAHIFEKEGVKVAIYSCAEREFTVAENNVPGANPFEEATIYFELEELKKQADYLVVLYHGGKEYFRYGAPYLRKRCRHMVEHGANLVLCQHSHCIGSKEEYKNSTVLYGQGNFIFSRKRFDEYTGNGLVVLAEATKTSFDVKFVPVCRDSKIRLAGEEERKAIIAEFEKRSLELSDDELMKKKYEQFAAQKMDLYYSICLGKPGKLLYKFKITRKLLRSLVNESMKNDLLNLMRCESHNDLFIEGIVAQQKKE